jgi:hypothetical protein
VGAGLVFALVGVACTTGTPGMREYRDPNDLALFEIPDDWHLYAADEIAFLPQVPFATRFPGDDTLPIIEVVAFDGAPSRNVANLSSPVTAVRYPVGSYAVRSVSSEERNRISRDSLEVVVLPPTFTIDESTKTEYDEDFGNDYEGIVRNLLFSDEETQQSGVVYFKSVLNPDDSRIYDIAVGCSVECWEEFGEEMVEVVDSWLINTRQ